MNDAYAERPEEQIASQLAHIGLRLHQLGLINPYRLVIEARSCVLDVIDDEFRRRGKSFGERG